ncbi:MAG: ATP-binding protein [Clostridiales bacterium]|jgi:serine/threonine-protein kinase RsbW|nr:ATP-binding protein [Clostridiales bacterium]
MAVNNVEQDCIQLSLPLNAAYVSAARLTASSVANRMGFSTDEIEDIKAAVSEACTFVIRKAPANASENFLIQFHMSGDIMTVNIQARGELRQEADEMSLIMIKALMNQLTIEIENDETVLYMTKSHTKSLFI